MREANSGSPAEIQGPEDEARICSRRVALKVLGAACLSGALACGLEDGVIRRRRGGGAGSPEENTGGDPGTSGGPDLSGGAGLDWDAGSGSSDAGAAGGGSGRDAGTGRDGGNAGQDAGTSGPPDAGSVVDAGTSEPPPDCTTHFCLDLSASSNAALQNVNGSVVVRAPNGDRIIVIRSSTSTYAALSDVCTHEGCLMRYVSTTRNLFCPCHGAKFGLDGRVQLGPARVPVRVYSTQVAGSKLVITL